MTGAQALANARGCAAAGHDEAAKQAYVALLRRDPRCLPALRELGALACASGHRSAARTTYSYLVQAHPDDPIGRVALANILAEDGDAAQARLHYDAALRLDPHFPAAHQGLARLLAEAGDPAADQHWDAGFAGHAVVTQRYRGIGPGVPLLLLVCARGGNIATRAWIDDRRFAVTAIYADFYDPTLPLPPHALVVNAIGDAEFCGPALAGAARLLANDTTPVINPPALVQATGRTDNARRLGRIAGVVVPDTSYQSRSAIMAAADLSFPLLLRSPGFHTGQHFRRIAGRADLAAAVAALPGEQLLRIEYLDARGPDGLARKYRVMFIDGVCYPLHLAISADWKVHYFSAAMAKSAVHRAEERRFLDDMAAVLGDRAMAALAAIGAQLGLHYAGADFALTADGLVLLFEANATMVIVPPDADPIWDYRRRAIAAAQQAAAGMLVARLLPARQACTGLAQATH